MLKNPFTPSEIASCPSNFFGRRDELRTIKRAIQQGSLALQGAIGIGKSSLLARSLLMMEGFDSSERARSVIAIGEPDVETVDQAARLLLDNLVCVDERTFRISLKIGSFLTIEESEICRFFKENRHMAALNRLIEGGHLERIFSDTKYLLFAIDEADKCPRALAQAIRVIVTRTQQKGITGVRFVVAGVSPFFQKMVNEDPGISRFFFKSVTLGPMPEQEAVELLEAKFSEVSRDAAESGMPVRIDGTTLDRVVAFAGGHPHLLQLLGSHLVESENDDFDGVIDARNLIGSLRQICYEDRAHVYVATLHNLELAGKLDSLSTLLGLGEIPASQVLCPGFPTRIIRSVAQEVVSREDISWFVEHNVLSVPSSDYYGLIDEFLRMRMVLDRLDSQVDQTNWERSMVEYGTGSTRYADRQRALRRREEEPELLFGTIEDFSDDALYPEEHDDDPENTDPFSRRLR